MLIIVNSMSHGLVLVISENPIELLNNYLKFSQSTHSGMDYFKKDVIEKIPLLERKKEIDEDGYEEDIIQYTGKTEISKVDLDEIYFRPICCAILSDHGFISCDMFQHLDCEEWSIFWNNYVEKILSSLDKDQIISLYDYHC